MASSDVCVCNCSFPIVSFTFKIRHYFNHTLNQSFSYSVKSCTCVLGNDQDVLDDITPWHVCTFSSLEAFEVGFGAVSNTQVQALVRFLPKPQAFVIKLPSASTQGTLRYMRYEVDFKGSSVVFSWKTYLNVSLSLALLLRAISYSTLHSQLHTFLSAFYWLIFVTKHLFTQFQTKCSCRLYRQTSCSKS